MYDVAIIGGGPGGYPLALSCQKFGLKTCVIEKEASLGGVCLHRGCIPSKALLHATESISSKEQVSLIALMHDKEGVIASLSQGLDRLFQAKKIDRIHGFATLSSPHDIDIESQEARQCVTAKRIVLATGSKPIELPHLPFDEKLIVSSTGALDIQKVPQHFVVIGAGVIGVELASVYKRLGSKVTIIEMLPMLCFGFDSAIRKGLLSALSGIGIEFVCNTQVISAEKKKEKIKLVAQSNEKQSEYMADRVLVAVGRRPQSEGLGLEKLGVVTLPSGHIKVNEAYCTSVPSIFAIGDLILGPMLAHRASAEGEALAARFAGKQSRVDMISIPNVIYTSPEVAGCGLTEDDCQGKFDIKVGISSLKHNGRALASHHTEGFVKVIGEKSTKRLLGVHVLAHNASEMIAVASLALQMKAKVCDLANLVFAHPTISEAIKEAALNCC